MKMKWELIRYYASGITFSPKHFASSVYQISESYLGGQKSQMEFQGLAAGDSRSKSLLVMKLNPFSYEFKGWHFRKLKIINDFK